MTLEQINKAYQALCAEFGHLTLIQRNTNTRIADIESQIAKLNAEAGKLKEQAAQEAKNAASAKHELEEPQNSQAV